MGCYKKPDFFPEWFDLGNYDGLKNAESSFIDFLLNHKSIAYRNELAHKNRQVDENEPIDTEDTTQFYNSETILPFLEVAPIVQHPCYSIEPKFIDKDFVVKSLDFKELCDIYIGTYDFNEPGGKRAILNKIKEQMDNGDTQPLGYYDDDNILNKEINECNDVIAYGSYWKIDLAYSDEVIIENIKKHLLEIRSKQGDKRHKLSNSKVKAILQYNIIPCIDLILWQTVTNIKLTDQQMTDLLFPNSEYYIDNFRQTIKPKAIEFLQNAHLYIIGNR
ncbi:DUF6387 family protein [Pasteurella atlantica]|uniref:DUF6387 family protein n=1 Tax=Pasteurellaceae TaxID=712 RepID=UPI001B80FB00|nr:DUF6387 family protein [Pasteurella atlantica]MBR0572753.1 hypothetical protein [Pasteurella atlantica]MDP8040448.1 DUF6387 family protein [Pasteurella atlantica]MDP8042623.1 DUF6387 family protein [Pasteurella atlantica]MDP8044726.1 DUF6387 family protein [Pasteurella atlantica]MDP8046774.1 DUF6387 family protein [Pasteurella atlantica]